MRAVDIIVKKRDKQELSREEIEFFVQGFNRGEIPDYQASAWAMAVLFNGMTPQETADLTMAIVNSGKKLDIARVLDNAVDKHSTGGVGDKTTLVVQPIVAACGLAIGKISGRGLGFSGGTLDKMESIPGFHCDLTIEEFMTQLKEIGLVLAGQTEDLAPADGKLYALRDVTGTVSSIPLIASSIMSKKLAAGARAIVLDVKTGNGAFMRDLDEARSLAQLMVEIARKSGRRAVALLSDMNQPLGCAVGNALEVQEAIETLHGGGPEDFRSHCLEVAAHLLVMGGKALDVKEGRKFAVQVIEDGNAWEQFRALVVAQGGDVAYIDHPERLPQAPFVDTVLSPQSGYIKEVKAIDVGEITVLLGGGRTKKGDPIDYAVGVIVHHKVGDNIRAGDPLFTVHANHETLLDEAKQRLLAAHIFSERPVDPLPLFYEVIR
ncbi:MAG: thymidine phosphorylase [Chloroflexota bacterium]